MNAQMCIPFLDLWNRAADPSIGLSMLRTPNFKSWVSGNRTIRKDSCTLHIRLNYFLRSSLPSICKNLRSSVRFYADLDRAYLWMASPPQRILFAPFCNHLFICLSPNSSNRDADRGGRWVAHAEKRKKEQSQNRFVQLLYPFSYEGHHIATSYWLIQQILSSQCPVILLT